MAFLFFPFSILDDISVLAKLSVKQLWSVLRIAASEHIQCLAVSLYQ